ncbi:MAG: (d)CMP kinase [Candidatus Omnitrophica bacterium]|nr:(d)CMP kinase [Candidatus Omnitrophota bacterium]
MDDIIAIDGPAGSGKSTVAKLIAKKLSYSYIDTGAMYRALTFKAIRESIDLEDEDALVKLAKRTTIDIVSDKDGNLKVLLDSEDVTGLIRTPELTAKVFYAARTPGVRVEMVKIQRAIGARGKCVFEGRDITTVVFPESKYKFYLDADVKERAKRRHLELAVSGKKVSYEDTEKDVIERDNKDKTRKTAPLRRAEDAVYIDTTNMAINEVVDKIISRVKIILPGL